MKRTLLWIWLIIILLALGTRLSGLIQTPLSPTETQLALSSLEAARGEGWPASTESPLLLMGNALLFLIFGPGDGIARFIPALLGCVLVLVPFLWRKRLGDVGASLTAGTLLTSALTLFASRQLDSALPGTLGAVLLLTVALGDMEDVPPQLRVIIGGAGLALGLIGGPSFYDVLLSGLVALGAYYWIETEGNTGVTLTPTARRQMLLGGSIVAALLASGLGWHWNNWLGLGDGLVTWFSQWHAVNEGTGPVLLLLYEPLIVMLAATQTIRAARRANSFALSLLVWALLALLLVTLRPGATTTSLMAPLVPLALLAGCEWQYQAKTLLAHWNTEHNKKQEPPKEIPGAKLGIGVHTSVVFILWMHAMLALARYTLATTKQGAELILVLLTVFIQAFLVFGMTTLFETRTAWRGLFFGSALAILVLQVGFTWGLGILRPADPVELAVSSATSLNVWKLRDTIDSLMIKEGQRRDTLKIALLTSDPTELGILQWTLRDFPEVQVQDTWPSESFAGLVITAEDIDPAPEIQESWQGMAATIITQQSGPRVSCGIEGWSFCPSAVKWYLYRQGNIPPQLERVLLWTKSL